MKLVGALAARLPDFGLLLPLRLSATAPADEILQGRPIDLVTFVDVDGAPDIPVELELNRPEGSFQRSPLGKCHLDDVLVRLSRQTMPPWDQRESPSISTLRGSQVCLVYDFAHFRERLSAASPQVL